MIINLCFIGYTRNDANEDSFAATTVNDLSLAMQRVPMNENEVEPKKMNPEEEGFRKSELRWLFNFTSSTALKLDNYLASL